MTQEANKNALQEAYENLPDDARASLRYHVLRDNGITQPLQDTKDNKDRITVADVERVMAAVTAEYQGLSPDQVENIRRMLESNVGSSRETLAGMQQQAEQVAQSYVSERSRTIALSPQQEVQKLWSEFGTCEKEMRDEFEKLYKDHKITYEQMQYMRNERARLDALPKEGEERITGETKFAAYQKELGINVRDQASKDGDQVTAQAAEKVVHQADAQTKRLEHLHELNAGVQKEKQQEIGKLSPDNQSALDKLSDDVSPTAVTLPQSKQKMTVVDATYDDVNAPPGGKDRLSGRTTVKT